MLNSFYEGISRWMLARRVNKAVKAISDAGKNTFSIDGRRLDMCKAAERANTFFEVEDLKALLQYYGNNLDHGDSVDRGDMILVSSVLIECLPDNDKLPELLSFLNKSKSVEYLDETTCLIEQLPEPYKTIHRDQYIRDNIKIHAAHNFDFVKDLSKKIGRYLGTKELEEILNQVVSEGNLDIAIHVCETFMFRPLSDDELVDVIKACSENSLLTEYDGLNTALKASELIKSETTRDVVKKEIVTRCIDALMRSMGNNSRSIGCLKVILQTYVK